MAINLLNSTNGGVHMNHGLNSNESQDSHLIAVVVIALLLGPVLLVLIRLLVILCSWAVEVVKVEEADAAAAVVAEAVEARAVAAEAAAHVEAEGLKKHELRLLPTAVYRLDRRDGGAGCECTICLGDFMDGEMVRILPCYHRFHVECIDTWLVSQVSCPNCRISLLQHVINI